MTKAVRVSSEFNRKSPKESSISFRGDHNTVRADAGQAFYEVSLIKVIVVENFFLRS